MIDIQDYVRSRMLNDFIYKIIEYADENKCNMLHAYTYILFNKSIHGTSIAVNKRRECTSSRKITNLYSITDNVNDFDIVYAYNKNRFMHYLYIEGKYIGIDESTMELEVINNGNSDLYIISVLHPLINKISPLIIQRSGKAKVCFNNRIKIHRDEYDGPPSIMIEGGREIIFDQIIFTEMRKYISWELDDTRYFMAININHKSSYIWSDLIIKI